MKKNWKFAKMALIAGMSLLTVSCSDDTPANENGGDNGGNEETYVLDKDITENLTLETGKELYAEWRYSCKARGNTDHSAGSDSYSQI